MKFAAALLISAVAAEDAKPPCGVKVVLGYFTDAECKTALAADKVSAEVKTVGDAALKTTTDAVTTGGGCKDGAANTVKTTCDAKGWSAQKFKKDGCKDADKDGDATVTAWPCVKSGKKVDSKDVWY